MKKFKGLFSQREKTPPRNSEAARKQDEFNELSPNSQVLYANSKKMAAELNRAHNQQSVRDVFGSPKKSSSSSTNTSFNSSTHSMSFFPSPGSSSSSYSSPPGLGPSPARQSDPWGGTSSTGRH